MYSVVMNGLAGLSRYLSPASHLTFLPLYACSDDLAWNSRTALLEMNWTELALTDLIDRSRLSPAPAQPMSVDHDFLHLPFEFRLLMPAYLSHLDNRPRQDFRPPLPSLLPWPGPPHLIASHAPLHPLTPFSPSAKHRIICICKQKHLVRSYINIQHLDIVDSIHSSNPILDKGHRQHQQ